MEVAFHKRATPIDVFVFAPDGRPVRLTPVVLKICATVHVLGVDLDNLYAELAGGRRQGVLDQLVERYGPDIQTSMVGQIEQYSADAFGNNAVDLQRRDAALKQEKRASAGEFVRLAHGSGYGIAIEVVPFFAAVVAPDRNPRPAEGCLAWASHAQAQTRGFDADMRRVYSKQPAMQGCIRDAICRAQMIVVRTLRASREVAEALRLVAFAGKLERDVRAQLVVMRGQATKLGETVCGAAEERLELLRDGKDLPRARAREEALLRAARPPDPTPEAERVTVPSNVTSNMGLFQGRSADLVDTAHAECVRGEPSVASTATAALQGNPAAQVHPRARAPRRRRGARSAYRKKPNREARTLLGSRLFHFSVGRCGRKAQRGSRRHEASRAPEDADAAELDAQLCIESRRHLFSVDLMDNTVSWSPVPQGVMFCLEPIHLAKRKVVGDVGFRTSCLVECGLLTPWVLGMVLHAFRWIAPTICRHVHGIEFRPGRGREDQLVSQVFPVVDRDDEGNAVHFVPIEFAAAFVEMLAACITLSTYDPVPFFVATTSAMHLLAYGGARGVTDALPRSVVATFPSIADCCTSGLSFHLDVAGLVCAEEARIRGHCRGLLDRLRACEKETAYADTGRRALADAVALVSRRVCVMGLRSGADIGALAGDLLRRRKRAFAPPDGMLFRCANNIDMDAVDQRCQGALYDHRLSGDPVAVFPICVADLGENSNTRIVGVPISLFWDGEDERTLCLGTPTATLYACTAIRGADATLDARTIRAVAARFGAAEDRVFETISAFNRLARENCGRVGARPFCYNSASVPPQGGYTDLPCLVSVVFVRNTSGCSFLNEDLDMMLERYLETVRRAVDCVGAGSGPAAQLARCYLDPLPLPAATRATTRLAFSLELMRRESSVVTTRDSTRAEGICAHFVEGVNQWIAVARKALEEADPGKGEEEQFLRFKPLLGSLDAEDAARCGISRSSSLAGSSSALPFSSAGAAQGCSQDSPSSLPRASCASRPSPLAPLCSATT